MPRGGTTRHLPAQLLCQVAPLVQKFTHYPILGNFDLARGSKLQFPLVHSVKMTSSLSFLDAAAVFFMPRLTRHNLKALQRRTFSGALLVLVFTLDLTLVQLHKAEHFCNAAPQAVTPVLSTADSAATFLTHDAESCPVCQHLSTSLAMPNQASPIRDIPAPAPSQRLTTTVDHPGRLDASQAQPRAPPAVVNG